jgi:Protein of unknown function (DUF2846)
MSVIDLYKHIKEMKLLVKLSIVVLGVVLAGCASTSKATVDKSDAAKSFDKSSESGIVYLYRPGRAVGAATQTQIKINGQDAGGTGPGTFFKWELPTGNYKFSCSSVESSAVVEVNVEAGEHYFLRQDERLGINGGRVTLKTVDEKTGMEAVKKYKLLISTYNN